MSSPAPGAIIATQPRRHQLTVDTVGTAGDREDVGSRPVSGRFPEPSSLVAEQIAATTRSGWTAEHDQPWTYLHPPVYTRRIQGWKLHVSATVMSAPQVLRACLPLLVRAEVPFKFAATSDDLVKLNDFRCQRGASGKFLTVYPRDDRQLRELAEALHDATAGLTGPHILSDAPYRQNSLVHYRFGAFDGYRVLTNDGTYLDCVLDPDTNPVEDRRPAVFQPPAWAANPFPADPTPPAAANGTHRPAAPQPAAPDDSHRPATPQPAAPDDSHRPATPQPAAVNGSRESAVPVATVLLNGRYEVRRAIRHANKGGVYRALDRVSGNEVIIKEARPHVGTDLDGRDARDYLRHEAFVLRRLAGLGVAPAVVEEFTQDGHVFLVEELFAGTDLRERVDGMLRTGEGYLTPAQATDLAERLAQLLRTVHDHGVVLRDLTPNNLIALPDGGVRVVDLELAAVRPGPSEPWSVLGTGSGTPGVSAPEQFTGAAPDPTADLFSLGATLLHQVTHINPDLAEDTPPGRSLESRVAELLVPPRAERPVPDQMYRIITGLMRTDPARRISLEHVLDLARTRPRRLHQRPSTPPVDPPADPRRDERWDALINGILGHLAATAAPAEHTRPWPETAFGSMAEPCAVQHGVAGTLAVLAQLAKHRKPHPNERLPERDEPHPNGRLPKHDGPHPNGRLPKHDGFEQVELLAGQVAARIVRHLDRDRHRLPGLYFGAAGTAWALHDAGRALDRPDLVERARQLVTGAPTRWPNPDIAHGVAGLGTCLLHLAETTGDADLLDRAVRCAESVLAAADPGTDRRFWTIPGSFASDLAGYRSYGFAHGVAGIGAFLLAAARAAGREDFADAARRAAETLLADAVDIRGAAYWPDQPGSAPSGVWWCNGSSGVGTFLCRMYAHTGEPRQLEAATAAARAVMATRCRVGTSYCHGLAGNGDFLIDLAQATGDRTYLDQAGELAELLWTRRIFREGHVVLPDETGQSVTAGFGAGLSGHLAFLVRLRFGGHRLFHPASTAHQPSPANPTATAHAPERR